MNVVIVTSLILRRGEAMRDFDLLIQQAGEIMRDKLKNTDTDKWALKHFKPMTSKYNPFELNALSDLIGSIERYQKGEIDKEDWEVLKEKIREEYEGG